MADPKLTPTFSLYASSRARDAGMALGWVTTDIRGFSRPIGAAGDLGAFEIEGRPIDVPIVVKNRKM